MLNLLRIALTLVLFTLCLSQLNAQDNFWQDTDASGFTVTGNQKRMIRPVAFRAIKLNVQDLLNALQNAPMEFTDAARNNPLILSLPTPDGGFAKFAVVYSPMMEPALAEKFPNIRTYSGQGIDDPSATLKMDWTEFGFHAQVRSADSEKGFYIDPYAQGENTQYISYLKKDLPEKTHIENGVLEEQMDNINGLTQKTNAGICVGTQLRTYRLAVACTGQYAAAVGASTVGQALSAITTSVNRVNGIFETELSVRLTLIGNNNQIVFLSTTTPFSDYANNNATCTPGPGCDQPNTLINRSQTVIDSVIGSSNYDLGHTFSTGAGGLAQRPSVCLAGGKARGVTGSPSPTGDGYDVDFVAHEMGHQLGGSHSFNSVTGGCGNGNRSASTAVEPGSGVTIMGYAGLCGSDNLASNSIPYFHATSQNEILTNVTSASGSTCGTLSSTGNTVPVVNAGADYTIPLSTPFVLAGSATDPNNSEVLTYSWEEIDLGPFGAAWNSGNTPFFRSFAPSIFRTRYFPKLSDVVSGTTTIGELLPSSAQTLNFRLTVRDNRSGGGGVCSDDIVVTTSALAGPFTVTSHSSAATLTANGSNTTTVTWNVASTNAAPVSTANVSILFSADGGQTFPYTLVASTPNDGSEPILVPSLKTSQGRIMVKAVGNIFFNVNSANLTISTACAAEGAVIAPSTTVTAVRGNGALNLALSPQYSTAFAPSGQITVSDPSTNLTALTSGVCTNYSNKFNYDTYTFNVTVTGSYTFTRTGSGSVYHIYSPSFTPGSGCTNRVATNFETTTGTSATMTVSLTAGTTYVMVIGMYGPDAATSNASLPFSYSVAVTAMPPGASVYNGSGVFGDPGAGFSYTYVIVNNATGNIVAIGASDLTNSTTFPPGQYSVFGLSYASSISNLSSYVGGSFTAFATQIQNNPSTFCANLSKNGVTVNVTGVLPVQMTALKAKRNGTRVDLSWSTLTEQNSSHFVIQRSATSADFAQLGKVQAAGSSNGERNYSFVDASPLKGWNYYRLQEFDLDGKFMYSNIATVNFDKDGSLIAIYPNPARDVLNIEYTSQRSGKIGLQVMDSKGSVLLKRDMIIAQGINLNAINIASLSKGVYILRYRDIDGNTSFIKFIKQ
jgi:hypothetical protein